MERGGKLYFSIFDKISLETDALTFGTRSFFLVRAVQRIMRYLAESLPSAHWISAVSLAILSNCKICSKHCESQCPWLLNSLGGEVGKLENNLSRIPYSSDPRHKSILDRYTWACETRTTATREGCVLPILGFPSACAVDLSVFLFSALHLPGDDCIRELALDFHLPGPVTASGDPWRWRVTSVVREPFLSTNLPICSSINSASS